MTDLTGQSIGRYQILSQLGEGGMAIVYKARDTRLDRAVALKLIRVDQFGSAILDQILKRFEREAKSLARLSHPNIVTVHDYGEYENVPYLVLEYCPGGDLKSRLSGQPMDWREALQLILPVARALRYSHKQGVVHRDVKPSNVMFSGEGEPMLSDFGIAKILEQDNAATLTGTGVGIGTPGYMAPEQWTGETSSASDQYGLGIVLYELLTGRKPYDAKTPAGIYEKQLTQPLPTPSQFAPAIPQAVESSVLKALDKDPDGRYADMAAFITAFEGLLLQTPVVDTSSTIADPYKTIDVIQPASTTFNPLSSSPTPFRPPLGGAPGRAKSQGVRTWLPWGIGATIFTCVTIVLIALAIFYIVIPAADYLIPLTYPTATRSPTRTPTATQSYTPTATALSAEITDTKGVTMRLVPAGPFTMGSIVNDDEKPIHTVTLDDYYMDVYEVTNAAYAACVDAGSCTQPYDTGSRTHSNYFRNSVYMNYPVIYVDWDQAKAYCEWRGARLPTEAEWEKAARGTDGRIYPWGDANPSSSLLNYNGNVGDTTEVGSYESGKSPYGMYDMAGNVWEWVNDWYDSNYYQNSPADNPQGPSSDSARVLRGGAWNNFESLVRAAYRYWDGPAIRDYYVGFRCSRSP